MPARGGLMKVLSRRKSLMEYLKAHNRRVVVPCTICVAMLEASCCVTDGYFQQSGLQVLTCSNVDAGQSTRKSLRHCGSVD